MSERPAKRSKVEKEKEEVEEEEQVTHHEEENHEEESEEEDDDGVDVVEVDLGDQKVQLLSTFNDERLKESRRISRL